MFYHTELLNDLFFKYEIFTLSHGSREDKLGDVFEDYCVEILNNPNYLEKAKHHCLNIENTEEYIFNSILSRLKINANEITFINASRDVEHRYTGGNSKTDVIADIIIDSHNKIILPISVKQTTASKVSMAEFDVETIINEIGIDNTELIHLLYKHQADASAINFTPYEKDLLIKLLIPYREKFVRWVITGSATLTDDLKFPQLLLKFKIDKRDNILDINCYTPDEYISLLIYDKYGNARKGGFGTGLSWTYATGSKGRKIQFKG